MMKVLVIRYSSLGDVLITTPIIRTLVQQRNAEVHFITKTACAPLLKDNPYISRLWLHEMTNMGQLYAEKFDHVVDLHGSLRSILLKSRLGHFRKSYNKERSSTRQFIKSKDPGLAPRHVLLRYFDCAESLDISYDGLGLDVFPLQSGGANRESKPHVAVVLGGTYVTKRIPSSLIKDVLLRKDLTFSLLGGDDVSSIEYEESPSVKNYIGRTTLRESISILSNADIVITGDTGLMHVAAALSKPTLVIWGSTSPLMGFKPIYKENSMVENYDLYLGLDCQPCSKYGKKTCPLSHMHCLRDISSRDINKHIDMMISGLPRKTRQKI